MTGCLPPEGAARGSLHVLSTGAKSGTFKWTGVVWSTPGSDWGTSPERMAAFGWRYVCAAPSQEAAHAAHA